MNLAQRTLHNLRVSEPYSLAAGSMQRIMEGHHPSGHAGAGHVELSLNRADATPGVDRKHLLRVE